MNQQQQQHNSNISRNSYRVFNSHTFNDNPIPIIELSRFFNTSHLNFHSPKEQINQLLKWFR